MLLPKQSSTEVDSSYFENFIVNEVVQKKFAFHFFSWFFEEDSDVVVASVVGRRKVAVSSNQMPSWKRKGKEWASESTTLQLQTADGER